MSVREPDEATIRASLEHEQRIASRGGWADDAARLGEALAALDRLVADRDTARDLARMNDRQAATFLARAEAAEAEVAVLTARLEASHEVNSIFEAEWKKELARCEALTARLDAAAIDRDEAFRGESDREVMLRDKIEALTARLTEADEALREAREPANQAFGYLVALVNHGGDTETAARKAKSHVRAVVDILARAALEAAQPRQTETGGDVPSPVVKA